MNKKILPLSLSIFIILLIVIVAVFVFRGKDNVVTDKKSMVESMYVEKGLESVKEIAKNAVESYAYQSNDETASQRSERLKKYFLKNSPVYGYATNNLNSTVTKTTAKVTRIESWSDIEGSDLFLIVTATVTSYYEGGSYTTPGKYWLSLSIQPDGSYIPDDVGVKDD